MLCLNLHESFIVFVNFEDVEVVFGLNKLLDGAVVGGDVHHAGQVLKTPLAVHPHLNILSCLTSSYILRVPSKWAS